MQNFLPQKPKDSTIKYQLTPLARAGKSPESREYLSRAPGLQARRGAQSVIKAFRRQGIGSADVFNTARQAAPSEKIITETRIETVFQTDTVFLDVPKIVEKSA